MRVWPQHIIDLARALLDGKGDERVLADAFEELNCPWIAGHFRGEREGHGLTYHVEIKACTIIECIVGIENKMPYPHMWPQGILDEFGLSHLKGLPTPEGEP